MRKSGISDVLANSAFDTAFRTRNKLEKVKNYLGSHNYKKNEIIIVGDSPEEVEIGKSLGIKTVAITDGYYSTTRLKASKPDFLINNLSELENLFKNKFI